MVSFSTADYADLTLLLMGNRIKDTRTQLNSFCFHFTPKVNHANPQHPYNPQWIFCFLIADWLRCGKISLTLKLII
jgi:hypothetical protein